MTNCCRVRTASSVEVCIDVRMAARVTSSRVNVTARPGSKVNSVKTDVHQVDHDFTSTRTSLLLCDTVVIFHVIF